MGEILGVRKILATTGYVYVFKNGKGVSTYVYTKLQTTWNILACGISFYIVIGKDFIESF